MRIKKVKTQPINLVGSLSVGLLLILAVLFMLPTAASDAKAANELVPCPDDSGNNCTREAATIELSVIAHSRLAVALEDAVNISVTPDPTDLEQNFQAESLGLNVSTNNITGYKVYLQTETTDNKLNPTQAITAGRAINPLPGAATKADFANDTWGYAISKLGETINPETATYQAVAPQSATNTAIAGSNKNAATNGDNYELSFATKVAPDLPAATYGNKVVVSVITNPVFIAQSFNITNMQDMTPEICRNIQDVYGNEVPTTGAGESLEGTVFQTTLIDTRDGKSYRVAKLKDGRCWMTQNLELTLDANRTLTAGDSDLGHVAKLGDTSYDGIIPGRHQQHYPAWLRILIITI